MARWLWCIVLLLSLGYTKAQEQDNLIPETAVAGVITDDEPSRFYVFSVEAQTPVVIAVVADEPLRGLSAPVLRLRDMRGAILADTEPLPPTFGRFGTAYIAMELAEGGRYQVEVSRQGGVAGSAQGRYRLTLHLATRLREGVTVAEQLSNTGAYHFYYYIGEKDFRVVYAKSGGSFAPEVGVYQAVDGALIGIGYLAGDGITAGTLGTFAANEGYYIVVGPPTSALMTRQTVAESSLATYTLGVEAITPKR